MRGVFPPAEALGWRYEVMAVGLLLCMARRWIAWVGLLIVATWNMHDDSDGMECTVTTFPKISNSTSLN